jgi:hypothetical protein
MHEKEEHDPILRTARHARESEFLRPSARVTGQLYAGLSDKAKAGLASKLTDAGIGS